ncbi:carbohydrate ABC transporter permease [Haloarcula marina]|uniref:carbohydrate ABC transporter permease n=1 Tax=Haloarcula marina TaxID=2961574 RepID=UPI0020B73D44|nr:sugar ABC transporter permease [Halomicroarcula marina]
MSTGIKDKHTEILDWIRIRRQRLGDKIPVVGNLAPYIFVSPFYILFVIFLLFPILYTLYLSFFEFLGVGNQTLFVLNLGFTTFEVNSLARLRFVGLANYERLLGDPQFHQSLWNTLYITIVEMPIKVIAALGLAVILNQSWMKLSKTFRTLILIPVSANLVAYSAVFLAILIEGGFMDYLFTLVGLTPIEWITDPLWARHSLAGMGIWRYVGYNMIILSAGLQQVPQHLYEAAELDGANHWQKFWYVTLPQIRPILLFVVVTTTIGQLKKFSEPMTIYEAGAPLSGSQTIVMFMYRQAFVNFNLGYASAVTYAILIIIAIIAMIEMWWGE